MALNDNTLNKEQTQKRILLATLLSFAFFIAYDFLYLQPKQELALQEAKKQQTQVVQNTNNTTTKNSAPQTVTAKNTPATTVSSSKIVSTIKTARNTIQIDSFGRISQVLLTDRQYVEEDGKHIKLFAKDQLKPLEVRFSNPDTNKEAFEVAVEASAQNLDATKQKVTLTLTQKLTKTTLTKVLTFYPDGHYDIKVSSSDNSDFFITPGYRPDVIADVYADHGAMISLNDGVLKIIEDEDMDKSVEFVGANMASAFDRYYATVLYNYNKNLQVSVMKNASNSPEAFIHVNGSLELSGYVGPKEYKTLNALDPRLTNVIEYGWFTFIAKPMFKLLQAIHGFIGNWGWTIVFVTILIKLILFPLSHKGMVSMNKLKELAPKIKQIQEKYKDDKQKASVHMMELYQKEGANPMGGCLPMLLQIPVFFAIYRVLLNAIELKGAPWILWIDDLGAMDPYFVLPILMGATMYLQQRMTPNTMTDPLQQKMFQFLPVIFTFFFLWFPAGLTLYWFINNLFTMGQQYYVNQLFAKAKEERHKKHLEEKSHKKK